MGALSEIKKQAQKAFPLFMENTLAALTGEIGQAAAFFPLVVRADFGKEAEDPEQKSKLLTELYENSKNTTGSGYTLQIEIVNTRSKGRRKVLKRITFENMDDYLDFLSKGGYSENFSDSLLTIIEEGIFTRDELKKWTWDHLDSLCQNHEEDFWTNACQVAKWLKENPATGLFIREIPLDIDKSFIEENKVLIHSLTSSLPIRISFEADHGLLGRQTSLRFRPADSEMKMELCGLKISEANISIQDFSRLNESLLAKEIKNVFIIENEMVYLTFPQCANTICIYCRGYSANILKLCEWLKEKTLYYFGDIEEYSFDILSSLRFYFNSLKSFCMDIETLDQFSTRIHTAQLLRNGIVPQNLTEEEKSTFLKLRKDSESSGLNSESISIEFIKTKLLNLENSSQSLLEQ